MTLMEKLPGITPHYDWYWNVPDEQRSEICAAFQESYTKLLKIGISHRDEALRNLLWDNSTKTCWIIDFERVYLIPEEKMEGFWWKDTTLRMWGLKRRLWDQYRLAKP